MGSGRKTGKHNFNYGWHFMLADAFPLKKALAAVADGNGRHFYERDYREEGWKEVSLPHTYNDEDLFVNRIEDAGSGQRRTFSCYRKWFRLGSVKDKAFRENKVFLEAEGIRQTCYLYVNGRLAGYYEAGAFPVGFDITEFLTEDEEQLIAIATDSTSSRNMDYISAETPCHPDAVPGDFVAAITSKGQLPGTCAGVAYQWNCNDFNPTVGGLSRNIYLHIKPKVYLTLPLYSNLKTKGVYVYATDFDIGKRAARLHVEAEARNEGGEDVRACLEVVLRDAGGRVAAEFRGCEKSLGAVGEVKAFRSIIPENAYRRTDGGFEPVDEAEAGEVETGSHKVELLEAEAKVTGLNFWDIDNPYLYQVCVRLLVDGVAVDEQELETGFRKVAYAGGTGLEINGAKAWLTGYAQRATNEWAALGCAPDWLKDEDARLIRESNANHIRFMHVAGSPADIRSYDRFGVVCTQPAGDKEREVFGRQWKQRVELMRDTIIYFRNSPSILFWEAGTNSIGKEHMREMRLLKEKLDPHGGRYMGCRTINTQEVISEAEYAGTMLNRHAATFIAGQVPITETEYLREESPRRVWDDFTPPFYDYDNLWLGKGGRKQTGYDFYDLTAEEFALAAAAGYQEFFNDRVGGASGKNLYSAAAALCWTDSAQHGRQSHSENGRMSGRVDAARVKKQSFRVFQVMQSPVADVAILGHWNYPQEATENYRYALKEFDGTAWVKTGGYGYRNPKDKTVYVAGSYDIARVELYVNGRLAGSCDRPRHTFIFPVPHVDVTQSGSVRAEAYDYRGKLVATDTLETAGEPARLKLTAVCGEKGFFADGADVAYIDIEVQDKEGRVCPLCDSKIRFSTEGPAEFLGGYNSGRFKGPDGDDSVIHKDYVYAECGTNRVFLRAGRIPGEITVTAVMEGERAHGGLGHDGEPGGSENLITQSITLKTVAADTGSLSEAFPSRQTVAVREDAGLQGASVRESAGVPEAASVREGESLPEAALPKEGAATEAFVRRDAFPANALADAAKYQKKEGLYCKVLVNGQEPDTHGIMSKVENGSIYSPILYILKSMHGSRPEAFSYSYEDKVLTIDSGEYHVEAAAGHTHMLVNGEENLLNAQPFEDAQGNLIVEINAVISYIQGVSAVYDEMANLFRISW